MKILLVVDMQNDFIDGSLGTPEAVAIVPTVAEHIRHATADIILFTQDTHQADYLTTQEGTRLPVVHCVENTVGWAIHPALLAAWEANTHTRRLPNIPNNSLRKGTFGSKELVVLLQALEQEESIEGVELLGLCTDICVISNAMLLKAYFPEALIQVYEAACAGATPENHRTALTAMQACQIDII